MEALHLGTVETRFAQLVWENAPLPSGELVRLCERELSWKKSTTYTVLKKLCERGIFQNQNGVVSERISREEYYAIQSERFVDESFSGSLPAFIAAFAGRKGISAAEAAEIRNMIDAFEEKKE